MKSYMNMIKTVVCAVSMFLSHQVMAMEVTNFSLLAGIFEHGQSLNLSNINEYTAGRCFFHFSPDNAVPSLFTYKSDSHKMIYILSNARTDFYDVMSANRFEDTKAFIANFLPQYTPITSEGKSLKTIRELEGANTTAFEVRSWNGKVVALEYYLQDDPLGRHKANQPTSYCLFQTPLRVLR
ncbi:MAG: hypothetical protein AABZ06_07500 [Bdellovibrionota bacterium]